MTGPPKSRMSDGRRGDKGAPGAHHGIEPEQDENGRRIPAALAEKIPFQECQLGKQDRHQAESPTPAAGKISRADKSQRHARGKTGQKIGMKIAQEPQQRTAQDEKKRQHFGPQMIFHNRGADYKTNRSGWQESSPG